MFEKGKYGDNGNLIKRSSILEGSVFDIVRRNSELVTSDLKGQTFHGLGMTSE